MNTIQIFEYGTDLSSRSTGRAIRKAITDSGGESVVLDFKGVRSVSHSFADELLAVLVEERGEDWFRSHVRVINHAPIVRITVLDAIQNRLETERRAA